MHQTPPEAPQTSQGVFFYALRGLCPACGKGKLYRGLIGIAPVCGSCGLNLAAHEQGDGPATLGILLVGALAAIGAVLLDVYFTPPLWLHALLWPPFILIASLLSLRWGKGALVAVQYRLRREDFKP